MMSCGGEEDVTLTGISLDASTLELEVQSSSQLTATLQPEGAVETIEWSSSAPGVASVNNGIVTAIAEGEATIAATAGAFTATCEVTVVPKTIDPGDLPASLKGSDYYIIQIDEQSAGVIEDKITLDFRPDEDVKNLYVWPDGTSFVAGTPTGTNSYGLAEGWVSLVVASLGWSGAGYNVAAGFGSIDMTNLYNNPEDYVFHVALKSSQTGTGYTFIFSDGTAEAKVVVGPAAMEGVEPYTDFPRDGEWHEIEIPVTELNNLGVFYNSAFSDVNILSFLAGGVAGTTFDMDAAFFYKKPVE